MFAAARGRAWLAASCIAASLLPAALSAAELYRWVDEQGRPHVADRPPPNPPANMRVEPIPAPDANTQQGIDRQQRQPVQPERRPVAEPAEGATPAAPQPSSCAARWAAYQRSQSCFEAHRTAEAGLKPEAFAECGPEEYDPSPECGPVR